jgi:hypothetical protein
MAKRFTDTEIWNEDWHVVLPTDYKVLWRYICDACDCAGVWRPNILVASQTQGFKIDLTKALELFNNGKERVRVLPNGRWFLTGFIPFQYGGHLSKGCSTHRGIIKSLIFNEIDSNPYLTLTEGFHKGSVTLKDKDKDKDKSLVVRGDIEGGGSKKFVRPTPEEVTAYAKEISFELDGQKFCDYYESKGWTVGRHPMKNWKACVRTWKSNGYGGNNGKPKDAGYATAKPGKYPD